MAWRVASVSSNLTGLPVFFWRTLALSAFNYPHLTSDLNEALRAKS